MSTSLRLIQRLLAACSLALALTACQNDESRPGGETAEDRRQGAGEAASLTTPTIIGVATAINEAEVEQATAVQARLTDPSTRRFAEQMIRDHGAAVERLSTLSTQLAVAPEDSDLRQELVRESQEIIQRLHGAEAGEVDREYMASQVVMHRRALEVIDERLLPAVQDERLRQELTSMRGHVAAHLVQAEQLGAK